MDLIVGLAGDSVESFRNTLDGVVALHPESITVHTLALKRSSNINKNGKIHFINDGEGAGQMLNYVDTVLTKQNYIPYYLYRQSRMVGNLKIQDGQNRGMKIITTFILWMKVIPFWLAVQVLFQKLNIRIKMNCKEYLI